jgi:lysozyme
MKITAEGLSLIKQFEGFRSVAYRDAVGIWTIGYGHTAMAGAPEVMPSMTITQSEGEQILARDIEQFARGVRQVLAVTLSDRQFSALVSFAFNVGLGNFRKSSVLSAANRSDFAAVVRRLQLWNKAGGRVLPGLVRRRAAEAALFASEHMEVTQAPVERTEAKPVHHSKTVWSAVATLVFAVLQAWLVTGQKLAGLLVLLAMAGLLSLIIYERWKKLKEEAL